MVFGSSRKFIGERLWMEKYILTQKSFGGENIITHDDDDGDDDDGCEPAADLINVLFETTSPHTGLMIFVVRRAVLTKSPPTSSLIGPLHSVQLPAGVHGCGGGGVCWLPALWVPQPASSLPPDESQTSPLACLT